MYEPARAVNCINFRKYIVEYAYKTKENEEKLQKILTYSNIIIIC